MPKDYPAEKRSWVMSRIKGTNTKPEITLRRKLWAEGLRYRKNVKTLPGKPDIVFSRRKLAVFVDGAFWHGRKLSEDRLGQMSPYWQSKIKKNKTRDAKNNQLLADMGYLVLRFTDVQIERNLNDVVSEIRKRLDDESHATA